MPEQVSVAPAVSRIQTPTVFIQSLTFPVLRHGDARTPTSYPKELQWKTKLWGKNHLG